MDLSLLVVWAVLAVFCLRVVLAVYPAVLPSLGRMRFRPSSDRWVLVTGATGGVGSALCRRAAKRGCRVIATSTTLSK
ncbi:hypothetical protein KIPB_009677, partial [Kipferlia bialata]|eukprot:g9677.t1